MPDDKNDDECGRSMVLVLLLVDMVDDESHSLAHSIDDDDDDDDAVPDGNRSLFAEFGRVDDVNGIVPHTFAECLVDFSLLTEFGRELGRVKRPCTMCGSVLLPRNELHSNNS